MRSHPFTKDRVVAFMRGIPDLPFTCARALQQPHIQYRVALFLAAILALFLGWALFLSRLPHLVACIGYY